ncbi:MAG TPA: MarR family transcriptional regulator [Nitriliruptorales bacterium]|nr:MarR family transcriptional regulator [Nitriliruptorales bacterium]
MRVISWRALTRAHTLVWKALERALEDHADLPLLSYEVLAHLSEAEGERMRMQDVAAALPLTRSGLTRLVDRLERVGLVRRESCDVDRRGTYAVLTPTGRVVLERAQAVHVRVLEEHLVARLSGDELAVLRAACSRIAGLPEASRART